MVGVAVAGWLLELSEVAQEGYPGTVLGLAGLVGVVRRAPWTLYLCRLVVGLLGDLLYTPPACIYPLPSGLVLHQVRRSPVDSPNNNSNGVTGKNNQTDVRATLP